MAIVTRRSVLLGGVAASTLFANGCSAPARSNPDKSRVPTISSVEREASLEIDIVKASPMRNLQTPIKGLNHVLGTGQSLSSGFEAHPPLTTSPIAEGVLTLGDAVQSSSRDQWTPHTSLSGDPAKLQPLIARALVEDTDTLLSNDAAEKLEYRDFSISEAPIISAAYSFKQRSRFSSADIKLIATESARGGSSLTTIIRSQDGRVGGALREVSKTAMASGLNACLLWVNFVHGQTDEKIATDPKQYQDEMGEHLEATDKYARSYYNQTLPALKMITQATSVAVLDDQLLPIAQTQLDFTRSRDDAVIIAPDFCFQNKTIHLTANGSRMLGEYAAKVADIVLNQKMGWVPTQLYKVWVDPTHEKIIYATFLTWKPPIRFENYFNGTQLEMRPDKGIKVSDSEGTLDLAGSPKIVGPLTVQIELSRPLAAAPRLALCSQLTGGANNICDSDDAVGHFSFLHVRGMDDAENNPALLNKPYKLPNFALAQDVPIPYDLEK